MSKKQESRVFLRAATLSKIDGSNWMSKLDDDELVSALSIPGTHDSAAYTLQLPFVATQRMSIEQQLSAGCRYFDLRCGIVKDVLEMVHGSQRLRLTLNDVLDTFYSWLGQHPSEGVIVQLKKDREDQDSSIDFSAAVLAVIDVNVKWWRLANTTPTLRELRGKIQLFRRFRGPGVSRYGINVSRWQDNPIKHFTMYVGNRTFVTVQDHYRYVEPEPLPVVLDKKETEVKELLTLARSSTVAGHWYVNYSSTMEFNWYYRCTSRDVAEGGYYGFKHQPGMNDRLHEHFRSSSGRSKFGIVVMDFPDSSAELISSLYGSNFQSPSSETDHLRKWKIVCGLIALCVIWQAVELLATDLGWLRRIMATIS